MLLRRIFYLACLCLVVVGGGGCTVRGANGSPASQATPGPPHDAAEEPLVGHCVLPPRTRTTGGLVIDIPRRPLKATRQECARRGGRLVSAQEAWGPLAVRGDVDAQLHLANAQTYDAHDPQDCQQAAGLYQQAIARGDPQEQARALFSLAYLYETGCGVERDLDQARRLYARGLSASPPPVRADFGQFHALIIGNNNYRYLPKLETAVNDASMVAELLTTQYGFQVKLLIDATRDAILEGLEDLRRRLTEADNLLIYYAGHGVIYDEQNNGAWLPVDARRDTRTHWIKTRDVTDIVTTMLAYRVLIVADSCFSGAWTRSVFPDLYPEKVAFWIERLTGKRARLVLASGGLEPVPDSGGGGHSVFAKYFMQALKDNADILIGRRLFDHLGVHVPFETGQEPVYAPMRYADHEGGEFIFKRVERVGAVAPRLDWRPVAPLGRAGSVAPGPT